VLPRRLPFVLAIQVNQDVRTHFPLIAKAGSVVDALLTDESGETAVITYGDQSPL